MYSIPENLDSTEYSGWINQDLLLKDSRRQSASRKRGYDLTNAVIDEQCDDLRRRVLRPRHNPETQSSPGASRTRPIQSNRSHRRRQIVPVNPVEQTSRATTTDTVPSSSSHSSPTAYDLSLYQALATYNWPQNYLVAHTDPSFIQRVQHPAPSPPTYPHVGQTVPHFDPWILHNYLLASSGYTTLGGGLLAQDSSHDNPSTNISQLGYPPMIPDNGPSHNFIWQYPFLFNAIYSPLQSQVTRPPELGLNISNHNINDTDQDLSYLFRSTNNSRGDVPSHSNERSLPNYNNHSLPSPFSYSSLCPYHNINHIMHHNQPSSHSFGNTSSNLPDPELHQHQHQEHFNSYRNPSEMTFGHYWHQMAPTLRPVNYPVNSSNIDTLLHLAAHFEQRKRGITREELDKLPTHRHKIISDKAKKEKMCTDKSQCLVCLDEFESKQSIRTLHCSHEFHAKCIDKWLKINRTCPLCRADAFDGAAQKDGA